MRCRPGLAEAHPDRRRSACKESDVALALSGQEFGKARDISPIPARRGRTDQPPTNRLAGGVQVRCATEYVGGVDRSLQQTREHCRSMVYGLPWHESARRLRTQRLTHCYAVFLSQEGSMRISN